MTIRWNWGSAIAIVYTTFAAGTIGMVTIATRQRTDLVAPDYYARSLAHDRHAAAIGNARALGSDFQIVTGSGRVEITWPPAMARAIAGSIVFYRPADAASDRTVPAAPDTTGRQTIPVDGLSASPWRVQVQWTANGREYYAETLLVVR